MTDETTTDETTTDVDYDALIEQVQADDRMRPAPGWLMVRMVDAEMTTKGGLHLPETAAKLDVPRAIVLKVGPARGYTPDGSPSEPFVAVGDVVLYSGKSARFLYKGHPIMLYRERDVVAVVPRFTAEDVGILRKADPAPKPSGLALPFGRGPLGA